ncbi:MAG: XdhC family protein [Actinobacteria bacterium]|nr:XdhC family protein [Actinomycetota bacterium]
MGEIAADVERFLARGERVAVATVVDARRSTPRPVGAKLAVSERGEIAGSVSGGCVEPDVVERARAVLATGEPRLLSYGIDDDLALTVGLPCGGEIDVFLERVDERTPLAAPPAAAVVTVVAGERLGHKAVIALGVDPDVDDLIRRGRNGVVERSGERVFCEVFATPTRLLAVGAVDLAEELCRAARGLGWRTVVVDPRARFATRERLPSAHEIVVSWPDEAFARIGVDGATAIVALSHDDKIDVPALAAALRSNAFYVGALGSRRSQARRRDLLRDAGVTEEALERLAGPAGLDLGADAPAEVALSMLAEIVAVRNGREGGRLSCVDGPIHAASAA